MCTLSHSESTVTHACHAYSLTRVSRVIILHDLYFLSFILRVVFSTSFKAQNIFVKIVVISYLKSERITRKLKLQEKCRNLLVCSKEIVKTINPQLSQVELQLRLKEKKLSSTVEKKKNLFHSAILSISQSYM